ncbi:malignant fibrous histiocytoma-amplified sequence 1 homolog isoform X2 [Dreissena polymorpha]|nr:malignant fibrous histiocytoma-amplified sequence 1 homolog isoform X2 [Dreissena polymorpha]
MEKQGSAKSKSGSREGSPSKSAKKTPSPNRKSKSPNRKGTPGELKSAMRKGSGKDKVKKKTIVKSPDLTADGLRIIDMSGQGMTILPMSVVGTNDTGELILASNNLRSLPPEIKRLTELRKLDISRNGIRCTNPGDFSGLPGEIKELVNLVELKISECNLPYIPPAIWTLTHLKILDISRNKINILSPDIGELVNLQKLNLQQTNITTLPPEIAYCQELEEILLWGNVIESLPETLPEMLKLRTLAVNYRSFCAQVDSFQESEELLRKGKMTSEHIPLVVFELATLEVLDLENTKINNVPELSTISLRELYLCKNFLSKVPPSLFNLNHLQILDMSHNLLQVMPDEISRVKSLVVLRLNNNQIERIPQKIRDLSNLEELNISYNRIRYMPNAVGGLKMLRRLLAEKNELSSLPDEICHLENLETLDLTENRITALPMKMHQLRNITTAHSFQRLSKCGLWLYKNPIHTPPPEIWKTEKPEKIFEYLKKLAIIKTENLLRQKLLFFGESGSGKTSLINGLVHRKSILTNGETDKTRALTQTKWKTDNNVDFMLHDFGGDKAYSMLYPLFCDANALVLLVYNHGTYSTDTHYQQIGNWIEFFNTYMPGAVVKLVGTHLDSYDEYAVEDENANLSEMPSRSGSSTSRLQSQMSVQSNKSGQSEWSRSVLSGRSLHSRASVTPNLETSPNLEQIESLANPIPLSRSSSCLSQSKSVQELVKTNVMRQMQTYTESLKQNLEELDTSIETAEKSKQPMQYIKHLQIQQKKVENLLLHPLRIMPDIALVSNHEGLYGVRNLIESLELMVIDNKLFPNAQRSIPDKWQHFKISLKRHKTYSVTWKKVETSGKELEMKVEEIQECLQYLHDVGEILWYRDVPSLAKMVFHKPRILIQLLMSMFRHDMENFLNFEDNKVFLSKGMFEKADFKQARDIFLRNGQISRPLMNCFWFFEELDYDHFNDLVELVPHIDFCYSIPEPSIPKGELYAYPIVVLPWYNKERVGTDFTDRWNDALTKIHKPKILMVTYVLPLGIPLGLFEKITCLLQKHVNTRIDWTNGILGTTKTEILKLTMHGDQQSSDLDTESGDIPLCKQIEVEVHLTIVSEEDSESGGTTLLKELTREITDVMSRTPGLVWRLHTSEEIWRLPSLQFALKSVQFSKQT